jgi:hypothetical protein
LVIFLVLAAGFVGDRVDGAALGSTIDALNPIGGK